MEAAGYVRMVRAYWVGVLCITLLGVAAAAAYTFTRSPVYAADASGFVSTGATAEPALAAVNDTLAKSRAVSYVDIAESRATAQQVARELGLDVEPAELVRDVDVEHPVDTVSIKVTARAGAPDRAQALADAWVSALATQVAEIEDPGGKNRPGTLRVIPVESAALPTDPISPQPVRDLTVGALLGLLLGLAYAMGRSLLDRRLRTADAVTERFDVSVVGVVPMVEVLDHEVGEQAQLALHDSVADTAGAGEAFRKLRSNLTYMDVDDPPRVIVVTSPRAGDGKSTVSVNLAAAIAAGGRDVVLVDADLRRPTVAASLGLVEGVGLTDVLSGRVRREDALQESGVSPQLRVLASGQVPPNPSELLGSRAMRRLLDELAGEAMVILDAPPLLPVTDAAVLTAHAAGALIVIRAGQTVDHELETALEHVAAVSGRVLGVVLNKASAKDSGARHYSAYYSVRQPAGAPSPDGHPDRRPDAADGADGGDEHAGPPGSAARRGARRS